MNKEYPFTSQCSLLIPLKTIAAFAMESSSFLTLSSIEEEDKCLICNKVFGRKNKIHCFGVNGWLKFKEQAEKWSKRKIHKDNNE